MKRMLMRKPFSKMTGLTLLETMFAIAQYSPLEV